MILGVAASLRIASTASSFLLQSALAWVACVLLTRIFVTHRARFRIWMAFLFVFVGEWARMLLTALVPGAGNEIETTSYASQLHQSHRVSVMPWTARDMSMLVGILCCSYCAVVLALLVREAASHSRLRRALYYRRAPSATLQGTFDRLVSSQGLKGCSLWFLPGLGSPATLGWWRPQVVLPAVCQSHALEDVEAVLWHELKHVQRRDALWNSLMRLCSILLCFHPAFHYAAKAAVRERELACDAEVIQDHPNGKDRYASCLLQFARLRASTEDSSARYIGMTSEARLLEFRIRAILGEGTSEDGGRVAARVALAILMCLAYIIAAPVLGIAFNSIEPFDLNRLSALAQTSMRVRVVTTGRLNTRRRFKQSAASVAQSTAPVTPILAVSPSVDPALAAGHRDALSAAMIGFNSEMDSSVGENATASDSVGQAPAPPLSAPRGTTKLSISWTGIAISAAQQLRSLTGGSDHEHHD